MHSLALLTWVSAVSAFPFLGQLEGALDKRQSLPVSQAETNCGPTPCLTFNAADQYVDVTPGGPNPYKKPGSSDLRGECPGLNAAANHGFLPRNGLATVAQTVTGLGKAYNMGPDLATALAVIAIALTGDYVTGQWSIGGAFPAGAPFLSNPGGIVNSHNKYEGDSSTTRQDAYINHGDSHSLIISRFDHLYNLATQYTPTVLRQQNTWAHDYSVHNNPYFFSAPFSGLVAPAAYQFIINYMSNHSAANPDGFLDRNVLKSFFAVSGPDNAHVWNKGQEQIPQNWYRRPSTNQYDNAQVFADLAITAAYNPNLVVVGGNTGKTNSFVGVDIGNLTGGVYNAQNLLQGNNLGCFFFQGFEAVLPDELAGFVGDVAPVVNYVKTNLAPILAKLDCPQLTQFNQGLFNKFPGYPYAPTTQTGP